MDILSLDFGTSSLKLSVINENLEILKEIKTPYKITVLNNDWVEIDSEDIFNGMVKGINHLDNYKKNIDLIVYDAFAPSVVLMDEKGEALYPLITHLDRRSKKETKQILKIMGKETFQKITGIQPFTGGASITTIMWMKENQNNLFKKAYKIGPLTTYIYKKLTGNWVIDPTNASMTGLYSTTEWSTWSEKICNLFNIPINKLPSIEPAGAVKGKLKKQIAGLCGLKAGIPIAVGNHDATIAQIGAGNFKVGDILNISGSSEMISILTDKPIINDNYYLRNAIEPNQWQIFAITASGFVIDWFKKEFYKDIEDRIFYEEELTNVIDNYINKSSVKFLPYIAGDRQSIVPKKGSFKGLTLASTRRDLLAAVLTGFHEPILNTIKICERFMKLNNTIKVTGGMASPDYIRVKRKLLPNYKFKIKNNCPIIGNAMLALKRLNELEKS